MEQNNILRATPSAAGSHSREEGCVVGYVSSFALLSLLVVGCFECFGFSVKCVEASWLLKVGFYCFSNYSCYFGHEFCYFWCPNPIIWQACCLHVTTLGSILPAWGHPGGPWEQQEGHMGVLNKIVLILA